MIYTRDDRNTGFDSHLFGRNLITHGIHDVFGRSDKYDAGFCAGLNKVRILREKTIAWMDSINICLLGNFNNALDVQISINRTFIFFQLIGFVCFGTEKSVSVFLRINADCHNSELIERAEYSNGDFPTVRHQNFLELFHCLLPLFFYWFAISLFLSNPTGNYNLTEKSHDSSSAPHGLHALLI